MKGREEAFVRIVSGMMTWKVVSLVVVQLVRTPALSRRRVEIEEWVQSEILYPFLYSSSLLVAGRRGCDS